MLPPPEHRGRVAYYGETHLERLALVSQLRDEGVSLSGIQDVIRRRDSAQRASTGPTSRSQPPPVPPYRPVQSHAPAGADRAEQTSDARSVRLATVVVGGVVIAVLVAVSVFLVLRDAAAKRAELSREVSGLRDELSRLTQNPAPPTTVVVPPAPASTPPSPPAPPRPPVATTSPLPPDDPVNPPLPSSPPPAVIVNAPTCTTLPILNRCL